MEWCRIHTELHYASEYSTGLAILHEENSQKSRMVNKRTRGNADTEDLFNPSIIYIHASLEFRSTSEQVNELNEIGAVLCGASLTQLKGQPSLTQY